MFALVTTHTERGYILGHVQLDVVCGVYPQVKEYVSGGRHLDPSLPPPLWPAATESEVPENW